MTPTRAEALMARACRVLGHRTDTPCQATLEDLFKEALDRIEGKTP